MSISCESSIIAVLAMKQISAHFLPLVDHTVKGTKKIQITHVVTSSNGIAFSFSNRVTDLIKNYQKIIFDIHQMIIYVLMTIKKDRFFKEKSVYNFFYIIPYETLDIHKNL